MNLQNSVQMPRHVLQKQSSTTSITNIHTKISDCVSLLIYKILNKQKIIKNVFIV